MQGWLGPDISLNCCCLQNISGHISQVLSGNLVQECTIRVFEEQPLIFTHCDLFWPIWHKNSFEVKCSWRELCLRHSLKPINNIIMLLCEKKCCAIFLNVTFSLASSSVFLFESNELLNIVPDLCDLRWIDLRIFQLCISQSASSSRQSGSGSDLETI